MRYFELLDDLRIICFPLNIPKIWPTSFLKSRKSQRLITFILVNAIQYSCTLKSNIYYSNKQGKTTTGFSFECQSCTWPRFNPFCWQKPCSSCNSGIDLVVIQYTFLQLCSTPNKFLRLATFLILQLFVPKSRTFA